MTQDQKDELYEEIKILKILLDFHVKNRNQISLSDQEFEQYVNAVLDRMNEISVYLDKKGERK